MRRALIIGVVVAVAALGGVWAASAVAPCAMPPALMAKIAPGKIGSCPAPETTAADQPRAVEPPAVTVVPAVRREFVDRLFVSGTLVAREEAQVAARIDALTIVEVDAEDGDQVKQGQVLARLDRTQLDAMLAENDASTKRADAAIDQAQSMIAQSEAQLQFATDDFDRARKLAGGVMAVSTIEQRETAMKTAQAQLAAANHALSVAEADRKSRDAERQELLVRIDRTDVKATVSGIVSRRSAKVGADASITGEPLFRIIEDGAIDLEADVPEQSLAGLLVGMPAELKLPGVEGAVAGRVRLVNQEVDKASRTGKVRIALEDVSHAHIGAFASGQIELTRRDGVGAPATALEREGDSARLYVVRDGKIEERQVKPGIVEGESVEVRSGVHAGESVVARAASFLRPGDRVRPVPEAPASAGG
jgi:RND family efflux transporter MFP subunit